MLHGRSVLQELEFEFDFELVDQVDGPDPAQPPPYIRLRIGLVLPKSLPERQYVDPAVSHSEPIKHALSLTVQFLSLEANDVPFLS